MGQEYFGGPEYFQEFDPEKFARELKAEAAREKGEGEATEEAAGESAESESEAADDPEQ